jgi:multisubunit Na+/H+ antiporter MnhC subunit
MEALVASAIGILIAGAVHLLLYGRAYEFMLALLLLAHAANLFVFSMGGIVLGSLPILGEPEGRYPDPLPQAFVLTAIVINFGITTFVIALAVRVCLQLGTDRMAAFSERSEPR